MLNDAFTALKVVTADGKLATKIVRRDQMLDEHTFDASSIGLAPTNRSGAILVPDKDTVHYDPIHEMESVFCFVVSTCDIELNCHRSNAMKYDQPHTLFGVEPEFFLTPLRGLPDASQEAIANDAYGRSYAYEGIQAIVNYRDEDTYLQSLQEVFDRVLMNVESTNMITVLSAHHEVASWQFEISWEASNMLGTADRMILFKYVVAATALQEEYLADFSPKPIDGVNGNGCHVHQSTKEMRSDRKAVDEYAKNLCTAVKEHERFVKVCGPHEDSRKRLTPGFEAPSLDNPVFGFEDRTAIVRIPHSYDRVEFRLPDPTMNPYEALPMMLQYGMGDKYVQ